MFDGKSLNAILAQKSTRSCNICNVGPKHINDPPIARYPPNPEAYAFGIPVLHTKMHFMEHFFKVASHLSFKQGEATTEQQNTLRRNSIDSMQHAFKMRLGLFMGFVRPGSGTSSTGNCARKFFGNLEIVAQITGLNIEVLSAAKTLLAMISTTEITPSQHFREACNKLKRLYNENYNWYPLSPSLHKPMDQKLGITMKKISEYLLAIARKSA